MRTSRPLRATLLAGALLGLGLAGLGCGKPAGKPGPEPEVPRPDQVLDFSTLYKQNCVACHGDNLQPGAAISLANPVFLAVVGESNLQDIITKGVPGKLMPPFGQSAGGMLTDRQVKILAKGLLTTWGNSGVLAGQTPPPYKAGLQPDAAAGQQAYTASCARCHGASGEGGAVEGAKVGSIVDPSYLGLISDQELRNIVIAGLPGMPDWRSDSPGHVMSDAEITNVVSWMASHRRTASEAAATEKSTSTIHNSASKPAHEPASTR